MDITDMHLVDDKESCEVVTVEDDKEFRDFLKSTQGGLAIVPEKYRGCAGLVMKADAGDFAKWLHQNKPELNVEVRKADKQLVLRSNDFWLPIVFLTSNIALPIYLNLVASYVYDRMRGALQGEKARVHLEAIYEDKQDGISKKFSYNGKVDGLQKVMEQFDLNNFMDK